MTHELIEAEIVETLPIKRGKQEIMLTQQDDIEEEIKYLSIQELNTLLSVSDNAYRLAWLLCYETASRISEAKDGRISYQEWVNFSMKYETYSNEQGLGNSEQFKFLKLINRITI